MENSQIDKDLEKAFLKASPANLHGSIMLLTPDSVMRIDSMKSSLWRPGMLQPRCEFKLDLPAGAKQIHLLQWARKDYGNIEKWSTGIYQCGINFPGYCPACMKQYSRKDIVQLNVGKKGMGKTELRGPGLDNRKVELMFEGMGDDRYWLPIPFCDDHSIKSRVVEFRDKGEGRYVIGFTNKEYGKLFARTNGFKGGWFAKPCLMKLRVLSPLLISCGSFSAFLGGMFLWRGSSGSFGKSTTAMWDLPVGVPLFIGGLLLTYYFARYYFKNRTGEDLENA